MGCPAFNFPSKMHAVPTAMHLLPADDKIKRTVISCCFTFCLTVTSSGKVQLYLFNRKIKYFNRKNIHPLHKFTLGHKGAVVVLKIESNVYG